DVCFEPVHAEIHDREEQVLLALHVMIDAGFGDANGVGDVAHRGRVIAFVAEYLRRHVIDLIEAIGFFRNGQFFLWSHCHYFFRGSSRMVVQTPGRLLTARSVYAGAEGLSIIEAQRRSLRHRIRRSKQKGQKMAKRTKMAILLLFAIFAPSSRSSIRAS